MASFWYNEGKRLLATTLNLATADMRLALVMSNTTADTENDTIFFMSSFTTLDELNGANYSRQALTGEAVATDLVNDRFEFDANNVTFTGVSAGTRNVVGAILFLFVTNDADSVPIAYFDLGTIIPGGGDIVVSWNAEGILQGT